MSIKYYKGYAVTDLGEVHNKHGYKLKPRKHYKGYQEISLWINGKGKVMSLHRLVAKLFIPNPDGLAEVNHKDFDKTNNSADNLEWCTRAYNVEHARLAGKYSGQRTCRPRSTTYAKSGSKGVYFDKTSTRTKPYRAEIKADRGKIFVGYFATVEQATKARELRLELTR